MAYDSRRHVGVLYGGSDGTSSTEDTWEWNGASWTQVAETGPGIRTSHAMVNDSWRDRTVLFGGTDQIDLLGDTWEWDRSTWELRSVSGPPARISHAMAFDSARGVTVLFGGNTVEADYANDCWIWDGVEWTELFLSGPSGRRDHAMTFDSLRNRTVLFGGLAVSGRSSETWESANFIPVTVDQHPFDQTIESGDPVEFTVIVSGSEPIEFHWRKDGTPLTNDGRVTGVNTDTLTIDGVVSADAGEYDVVVSKPCGEAESEPATLLVTCAADFNNDGVVDTLDVLLYLNAFANGYPSADFNGDGNVDTLDFLAFLNAFVAGCP